MRIYKNILCTSLYFIIIFRIIISSVIIRVDITMFIHIIIIRIIIMDLRDRGQRGERDA